MQNNNNKSIVFFGNERDLYWSVKWISFEEPGSEIKSMAKVLGALVSEIENSKSMFSSLNTNNQIIPWEGKRLVLLASFSHECQTSDI